MNQRAFRTILAALIFLTTLTAFQNCGGGSLGAGDSSGSVSSSSTSALTLNEENMSVPGGSVVSLNAGGGTPPYTYSLLSGVGSVSVGAFYADTAGTAWIRVVDAAGSMAYFAIYVTSSTTTTTTTASASSGTPVPVYRFYSSSYGRHFFTLNYSEGTSMGYTYEGIPFYVVSVAGTTASTPLIRCYISGSNLHYATVASSCGSTTYESLYGYVYPTQVSGSVALYGFYNYTTADYIVTTNYAEGTAAGFTYWGTFGYVFTSNN